MRLRFRCGSKVAETRGKRERTWGQGAACGCGPAAEREGGSGWKGMKLTGGPRLSARERGGEGGWPAGPRPKKRKEGRGGMGLTGRKKERERWKKGFAFFLFFQTKTSNTFSN